MSRDQNSLGEYSSEKTSSARGVISYAARYFPATFLPPIIALGAVVWFSRIYQAETYGVYTLVLAITTPLTISLSEWIAQPVNRFYSQYTDGANRFAFQRATEQLFVRIALIVTSLGAITLVFDCVFRFIGILALLGVYLSVVTQCYIAIAVQFLTATMRANSYRRVVVSASGLSTLVSVLLVVLFGPHVACLVWGQGLANLILLPWVFRSTSLSPFTRPRPLTGLTQTISKRFISYGIPMTIWFFTANLLYSEDRYLLAFFKGPSAVAIYGVNYNVIATVSNIVAVPVLTALGPVLFRQWSSGFQKQAQSTISSMTEIYAVLGTFVFGGALTVGTSLVQYLLGRQYWPGTVILVPVLIGRLIWNGAQIGHKTLELKEQTRFMALTGLLAALANLVLNLILVPEFGMLGSAYATLLGYGVYALIVWAQSRRHFSWRVPINRILYYFAMATLSAVVTNSIYARLSSWQHLDVVSNLTVSLIKFTLFMVVYAAVFVVFLRGRVQQLLSHQQNSN